jgi:dolichyl-phosphate beta-glucosyltransferase
LSETPTPTAHAAHADPARPLAATAVSVVIPMFNESKRIGETLRDTIATLDGWGINGEIIAVDDGSSDGCAGLVRAIADEMIGDGSPSATRVRVATQPENTGKGAAVRRGFEESLGAWVLIMDADNSARLAELPKLATRANRSRAALAVGSRNHADSDVNADPRRKLSGTLFRVVLGTLGLAYVRDTQCGFKLYRRDAALLCAREGIEDGFAFDIEHLGLCRHAGLGVVEVGIRWEHRDGGTVRVVRDGLRMMRQAVRIRRRLRANPPAATPTAGAHEAILEIKPLGSPGAARTEPAGGVPA